MTQAPRAVSLLVILLVVAAGCRSMTGRSTGQYVDDKKITAEVKTKLAAEKLGTLTRVDVDTNQGTVYLTGTVENPDIKQRATEIAQQVSGVRQVVNNLQVQTGQIQNR